MKDSQIIEIDLEDETFEECLTINHVNGSVSYTSSHRDVFSASYWFTKSINVLKSIFLPRGYPFSVREEYFEYQIWDSTQGLCSYLRSIITTKAVLVGVGVGNPTASPFLAAIAWVLKDGMGMIGSLTLAYYCSGSFESYTKEWRLFADVLNNIGLTFDMLCSLVPEFSQVFLIISSISKASCGLVAGATKARISAHFAREGHLADVNAKESTQEIAVALLGMILGIAFAKLIGDDDLSIWGWFSILSIIHMYCNYRLTKILVFDVLNPQRIFLLTKFLRDINLNPNRTDQLEYSLSTINVNENLWNPLYLAAFGPKLGCSLKELESSKNLCNIIDYWISESFIIGYNQSNRICVCLLKGCREGEVIKASFLAHFINLKVQQKDLKSSYFEICDEAKQWYLKVSPILANSLWNMQSAACLAVDSRRLQTNQELKKQN